MEKRKTTLFPLNKESHFLIFFILMVCIMGTAMFLAMRIASVRKTVSATQLVLAGIAVNALFGVDTEVNVNSHTGRPNIVFFPQ